MEDIKQAINLLHKENVVIMQFLQVVLQAQGVPRHEIDGISKKLENSSRKIEDLFITKED